LLTRIRPRIRGKAGGSAGLVFLGLLAALILVAQMPGGPGRSEVIPADVGRLGLVTAPGDASPRLADSRVLEIAAAAVEDLAHEPGVTSSHFLMQDERGALTWVVRYEGLSIVRPGPPASGPEADSGEPRVLHYAYVVIDDASGVSPFVVFKP
jgi:hypothetical protein